MLDTFTSTSIDKTYGFETGNKLEQILKSEPGYTSRPTEYDIRVGGLIFDIKVGGLIFLNAGSLIAINVTETRSAKAKRPTD